MLTKPRVMAMSARYKLLLAVAYLASADAHFGVGDGGMALTGKTHQHQHQRLKSVHHRDGRILLANTLLRGGANGIEENAEYEESKNTDSISDYESNDSSSDGRDSEDESDVSSGEETEDEDNDVATCTLLPKTKLYHHSKSNKKYSSSVNKKFLILKSKSPAKFVLKLAQKNQFKLYILLAMIAFRHDIIKMVLQYKLIRTGAFSFTSVNWTTDVLKLILVAGVIVDLLADDTDAEDICAACGKHANDDVTLKRCTACKLVQYCSVDCQRSHRKHHKNACRNRAAELHDEIIFKQPEPEHHYRGDCPICFLPQPFDTSQFTFKSCCGKDMRTGMKGVFCFYRTPNPTSYEEFVRRARKRMKADEDFLSDLTAYQDALESRKSKQREEALSHQYQCHDTWFDTLYLGLLVLLSVMYACW